MRLVPRWVRSIRFRLAGLYTLVVFGLAVLVVGSIYFAFSRTLEGKPVTGDLQVRRVTSDRGVAIYLDEGGVEQLELLANQRGPRQAAHHVVHRPGGAVPGQPGDRLGGGRAGAAPGGGDHPGRPGHPGLGPVAAHRPGGARTTS